MGGRQQGSEGAFNDSKWIVALCPKCHRDYDQGGRRREMAPKLLIHLENRGCVFTDQERARITKETHMTQNNTGNGVRRA
jgi:hypothetical protein